MRFIKKLVMKWMGIQEEQDPHLVLYEEVKPKHCRKHSRYKKSCTDCQEIIK
jgi:hypothetical protein